MPSPPLAIARLRKNHYCLESLPETLTFSDHPAYEADTSVPIAEATVDDIAFAIIVAERESMVAYRHAMALQHLYKLARAAGGRGSGCAVAIAANGKASL